MLSWPNMKQKLKHNDYARSSLTSVGDLVVISRLRILSQNFGKYREDFGNTH